VLETVYKYEEAVEAPVDELPFSLSPFAWVSSNCWRSGRAWQQIHLLLAQRPSHPSPHPGSASHRKQLPRPVGSPRQPAFAARQGTFGGHTQMFTAHALCSRFCRWSSTASIKPIPHRHGCCLWVAEIMRSTSEALATVQEPIVAHFEPIRYLQTIIVRSTIDDPILRWAYNVMTLRR
jgi:hypothetical protein